MKISTRKVNGILIVVVVTDKNYSTSMSTKWILKSMMTMGDDEQKYEVNNADNRCGQEQ